MCELVSWAESFFHSLAILWQLPCRDRMSLQLDVSYVLFERHCHTGVPLRCYEPMARRSLVTT